MKQHRDFTAADDANFIAATTVGNAESYLGGRSDASTLYANTVKLQFELQDVEKRGDASARQIIDHTRLLLTAMFYASSVKDAARLDRWRDVMTAMAKLVRLEVVSLREAGVIGARKDEEALP